MNTQKLVILLFLLPVAGFVLFGGHLAHSLPLLLVFSCLFGHSLMHSGRSHHEGKNPKREDDKLL